MNSLLLLGQEDWIQQSGAMNWFPVTNTTQAASTDALGAIILWICSFSFISLMLLMCWFVYKYRRRPGVAPQRSVSHNTPLELAWSIIPLLILIVIFFMGFEGYMTKIAAPVGAEEVYITGAKWQWSARYRTGREAGLTEKELTKLKPGTGGPDIPVIYVPAGRPVKLIMQSKDVMHAFFIPDFRTKMDIFPNRYTSLWFEALEAGHDHIVFCAEYCGENHSEMAAVVRVVPWEEYVSVIQSQPPLAGKISELGERLRSRRGCATCHTVDGSPLTGPSWKTNAAGEYGFGTPRTFADGSSIPAADENYFRDSILFSQSHIVAGFGTNMPTFAGILSDEEVDVLIMYIKYLNGEADTEYGAAGGAAPATEGQTGSEPAPAEAPAGEQ